MCEVLFSPHPWATDDMRERGVSYMDYQRRVVAFIDILGWENAVEESVANAQLRNRMGHGLDALGKIVRNDVSEEDDPRLASEQFIPSDDQASQFSDSVIISYLFNHPHDLTRLIRAVSSYQAIMLLEGFPLRGGITAGLLYHHESVAFGPALSAAVALERKARLPRVIIDAALNSHVEKASIQMPAHWPFISQDEPGTFYADYLSGLALSPTAGTVVRSFIKAQLSQYAGDEPVLAKYQWLSEKFEQAIAGAGWRREVHERLRKIGPT